MLCMMCYNALDKNGTWILVLKGLSDGYDLVQYKVLFKHKFHRCHVSPVIRYSANTRWSFTNLMLRYAFLNGDLSESLFVCTTGSSCLVPASTLLKEFDMTDLGALNYFLGISGVFIIHSRVIFVSDDSSLIVCFLCGAHMVNCNPSRTPIDTGSKLGPNGVPVQDPTLYRSLAGDPTLTEL
ncbi:ribonuclease H-like domain-containing protein [Tanacetum coccineum]